MKTLHDRREFLRTAAVGLGFAAGLARAEEKRTPVVDTHVHCFAGKDDKRFPYHKDAPYRPEPASTPEQLLKLMDAADVDHAVIVHPEPYQDDHRYLERCLGVGGKRLKGTCLFFADRFDPKAMAALVKRGGVVALRIHAYAPERQPPFGKPELRTLWKHAAELGLAVQLHFEPRYAPGFEPLIKEFKETTVIVDHLGRPFQGTPKEHAVVVGWSKLPNVVMKLSAIPTQREYPHRDVAPVVKTLVEAYGAERLIYGGGHGAEATGATYRAARERMRSFLDRLSEADQAKVLGGNAARLFRFGA
jgi:predicted TIM-barrel fold metal-dependent hydrolase